MQDRLEEGPPAPAGKPMPVPNNADKETAVNMEKEAPAVERAGTGAKENDLTAAVKANMSTEYLTQSRRWRTRFTQLTSGREKGKIIPHVWIFTNLGGKNMPAPCQIISILISR